MGYQPHSLHIQGKVLEPAIELIGITKRFPGVLANDNVNLTVEKGEIHAVCGENGAGKSTLMKILYGMQPADEGTMNLFGERQTFQSPNEAIEAGIGMVHQHFMLANQLTVIENVILGAEPTQKGGIIDFDSASKHLDEVGKAYGLTVDPYDLVESLEVGERQRVEIIKVLFRGAKILIFDDCLSAVDTETEEKILKNLTQLMTNKTTIIVSHRISSIQDADHIIMVENGKIIEEGKHEELIQLKGAYNSLYEKQLVEN